MCAVISTKVIVSNERHMHLKAVVLSIVFRFFCILCQSFHTSSDMSNNHLEEMPPTLFSNTSNLKELYV